MVMNTIAHPNLFQIIFEIDPICRCLVSAVGCIDLFKDSSDFQVVLIVLVPHDVATRQAGHVQVVTELLLLQGELVPTRHLVAQHADVRELIDLPPEAIGHRGGIRVRVLIAIGSAATGREERSGQQGEKEFAHERVRNGPRR